MGSITENGGLAATAELDDSILSEIPLFDCHLSLRKHASSPWANSYRIDEHRNQQTESYFMKVSIGVRGLEALKGEFESIAAIHAVTGDFTPQPLGWGSFKSLPGAHYYYCRFYELLNNLPEPSEFCKKIADLHKNSISPNGMFGFHVTTYNDNLPQNNEFAATWKEFFLNEFKHMIDLNVKRGDPWPELEGLDHAMITKVIPRLLRPMETEGRSIKPSLIHGDIWCGNVAIDGDTSRSITYDPASFYGHNVYELGNWRPERNTFSKGFFEAYHSHIPISPPIEDYETRNALYSIRFNLHAAALFPDNNSFRELVISEMRLLVEKYPHGYEGYAMKRN